jgi:hypothetical protein
VAVELPPPSIVAGNALNVDRESLAAAARAVAENVTGEPISPGTLASTVWVPGVGPSVHSTLARPLLRVVVLASESLPPPEVTCHETVTPRAGEPSLLRTCTTSGSRSFFPTVCACPFPLTMPITDGEGGGAVTSTVAVCAIVTPPAVADTVFVSAVVEVKAPVA